MNSRRNIKHEILQFLMKNKALPYSKAKPENIENDLYNYHLQHLVKKGLVDKSNKLYSLSEAGMKYVHFEQPLSLTDDVVDLFKSAVLLIMVDEVNMKILAQKRKIHPHYGSLGIFGGVIHHGEKVVDAASRVFKDETSLSAEFKEVGVIRNVKFYKDTLFCDSTFYVCTSNKFEGVLADETEYGIHEWIDIDDAIKNEKDSPQSLPTLVKVLESIKEKQVANVPFVYADEVTHLKSL